MKKNSGITLLALIITIIIMLILAGVTISIVGGSDGIVAKAEKAVSQTDKAAMQEDAELSIAAIKMDYYENYAANRARYENAKEFVLAELEDVYTTSRGATMLATSTGEITYTYKGVATVVTIDENGSVTLGESSGSGEPTLGENYYGDSSVVPTDQKYFTFSVNEDGQTATITGIKDEYAVKTYYGDDQTEILKCAINDNGTYITDIVVPYEYVENGNTYTVTNIGDFAFGPTTQYATTDWWRPYSKIDLYPEMDYMFTSFEIPNTIISIGDAAFMGCVKTQKINISDRVTEIGKGAFFACKSMQNINIPESVTSIGGYAFQTCTSLKNISIPQSVISLGNYVFNACTNLSVINCESLSKPNGWEIYWNDSYNGTTDFVVNWGVSM